MTQVSGRLHSWGNGSFGQLGHINCLKWKEALEMQILSSSSSSTSSFDSSLPETMEEDAVIFDRYMIPFPCLIDYFTKFAVVITKASLFSF